MAKPLLVVNRLRTEDNLYVGSLFFVWDDNSEYALALEYGTSSKHWPFNQETFDELLELSSKETAQPYVVEGITIDFTQSHELKIIYPSGLRVPIPKNKWKAALEEIIKQRTQKTRLV